MSAKQFNAAVIGYGLSAKVFHIPLIEAVPELNLYGIVQRTPKPDDDASKDHPNAKAYRSAEEAFADPDVDVMVVTSVPETHFEFTKKALESGKHVVVEKPFVPTSKEANELAAIAKQTGKLLTVYQNRRWDSDFLTVKQILAEDKLGTIGEFETHFDRHRPELPPAASQTWKNKDLPAGGALFDLGSHLIDQVYNLFGPPKQVTGHVGIQRPGVTSGSPDNCTVLLRYGQEGANFLVTVKAAVISPEEEQLRYWIRGTKGSFKKFHLDVQEDQLKAGMRPGDNGFAVEPESHHGTLTVQKDGKFERKTYPTVAPATYVEYYRIFAKALQGQGEVPVKAEEAADVLRIIELAQESSRTGRTLDFQATLWKPT